MEIVKKWGLSENGDCQGMGIVKEWGLSRNGDCHGMGIVSEWRQKYLKISKTSKKTISTFSILCHGIVCRMNSPLKKYIEIIILSAIMIEFIFLTKI